MAGQEPASPTAPSHLFAWMEVRSVLLFGRYLREEYVRHL